MSTLEDGPWRRVVSILVLDRALDFYPEMGLEFFDEDDWNALRQWYYRLLQAKHLNQAGPEKFNDLLVFLNERQTGLGELFSSWAAFIANVNDSPLIGCWEDFLANRCRSEDAWNQLGIPEKLLASTRTDCKAATYSLDMFELGDERDQVQLSDWELPIYTLNGFNDDDNSPINDLVSWVLRFRFMSFMKQLDRSLGASRRRFYENCKKLAEHEISAAVLTRPDFSMWPANV